MRRTEWRRLSAESGFWKTICSDAQLRPASASGTAAQRGARRASTRARRRRDDAEQRRVRASSCRCPDSPTRPSVSPGQIAALTSVSAWTSWPRCLKTFVSSSSSTSGGACAVDGGELEVGGLHAREVCARARGTSSGSRVRPRRRRAAAPPRGSARLRARSGRRRRSRAARRRAAAGSRGSCPAGRGPSARRPAGCSGGGRRCTGGAGPGGPSRRGPPRRGVRRTARRRGRTSSRYAEVVADEEHRGVELGLELGDEIEHLRLDRRVEARRRLVEDQERRILRERHRDDDALLHPARELVRVAAHHRAGSAICTRSSASRARSLRLAPGCRAR